jgi:hypothetical protein
MWFLEQIGKSRLARGLRRDEDGAALLEMTVVTPFLVFLGIGLFEFSNALYQYHLVTGGLRDAARFAAGLPIPASINQNEACDDNAPWSTPIGCAKRLAITGQVAAGSPKRVSWWEPGHINITYPTVPNTLVGGKPSYRGPANIARVRGRHRLHL